MPLLVITNIINETHDVRTYVVKALNDSPISYKPGQFITLIVNLNGRELRRSYSISTSPVYDDYIAFTVKLVTNGEVSRYLFRSLVIGSQINTEVPGGRFTPATEGPQQGDIFLIAAGSGITPVFSLLKHFLINTKHAVKLILQNHSVDDVIFFDKLQQLAHKYPDQLRFFNFISVPPGPGWPLRRINNELLEHLVNHEMHFEPSTAMFYICGPLSFMRMAEFTLRQMHFAATQIKKEIFEFPQVVPTPFEVDTNPRSIELHTKETTLNFTVQYPQTILDAFLANNIHIPYSCRAGRCGSCVLQCTSGKVRMKINEVLTDDEVTGGLVLSCVGYALTNIEVVR
jgi:ring-1,2-phenylacetyl-CoA epoxidase subunit PaaE